MNAITKYNGKPAIKASDQSKADPVGNGFARQLATTSVPFYNDRYAPKLVKVSCIYTTREYTILLFHHCWRAHIFVCRLPAEIPLTIPVKIMK